MHITDSATFIFFPLNSHTFPWLHSLPPAYIYIELTPLIRYTIEPLSPKRVHIPSGSPCGFTPVYFSTPYKKASNSLSLSQLKTTPVFSLFTLSSLVPSTSTIISVGPQLGMESGFYPMRTKLTPSTLSLLFSLSYILSLLSIISLLFMFLLCFLMQKSPLTKK